jgi:hypothetical protein
VIIVTAPPAPVRRSFVLWIAAVVVGLVASGVSLAEAPAAAAPTGLVVGLLVLVLFVGCAVALRRGRAWARLVLTVVGGLSVLVTVLGLLLSAGQGVTFGAVSTVAGLVQAALIVAAILSAHRAGANAWFRHE